MIAELAEYEALLARVPPWSGLVPAGYVPNHLGALTSILFHAHWCPHEMIAESLAGARHVATRRPVFGDGESYFEQGNAVRSVLGARSRYVMVELGGGVGARAVDCALALRQLNPMPAFLVVVEALPTYFSWCHHHFRANGLDPADHWIINGIVSERPVPEIMNLRPRGFGNQVADATVAELVATAVRDRASAVALLQSLLDSATVRLQHGRIVQDGAGRTPEPFPDVRTATVPEILARAVTPEGLAELGFVSAFTLENVLAPLERVDFMDVDIQFAEIRVIPPNLGLLRRKVKLLSIGTHDGAIHQTLRDHFTREGWRVLAELAPWTEHESALGKFTTADGILTVENTALP